jgi:hypothetical protein
MAFDERGCAATLLLHHRDLPRIHIVRQSNELRALLYERRLSQS